MRLRVAAIALGSCLPLVGAVLTLPRLDAAAFDVGRVLAAHTRVWLCPREPELLEFVTADDRPIGSSEARSETASEECTPGRVSSHPTSRRSAHRAGDPKPDPEAKLAPAATSRFVSARRVLDLAKLGIVPRGTAVSADTERPPGVRYSAVAAFGVGLREGDVLTHVAGQPVRTEEDVVTAVLSARQRRASHISGRFWRAGESHELVVEMPYPKSRMAARALPVPASLTLGG